MRTGRYFFAQQVMRVFAVDSLARDRMSRGRLIPLEILSESGGSEVANPAPALLLVIT